MKIYFIQYNFLLTSSYYTGKKLPEQLFGALISKCNQSITLKYWEN